MARPRPHARIATIVLLLTLAGAAGAPLAAGQQHAYLWAEGRMIDLVHVQATSWGMAR